MRLTLYGIYQYDPTLFDDVVLPIGIMKDYLIDEIFRRSGDLFTYYQVPEMLKRNITSWFGRNYSQFDKMINALIAEYNPIENYDRYEDSTDTPKEVVTSKHTGTDTRTIETTLGSTSTSTNEKSGFDSSSYSPNERNTTTTSGGDSSTDSFVKGTTDTVENSGTHEFSSHIHGNIGVTTNSKMVSEELELRKFDIYSDIARRFEHEFLIDVY